MSPDPAALLSAMTLDEKAALTAGADIWHTAAIERLGVPQVKMTDGPNGVRGATGTDHQSLTPSICIPSGSALGATWDTDLVAQLGTALARQARQKSARVLLAPTVNLHRHPLWGRNFEAFSEDPLLSGKLAAAYIRGVQSQKVAATVKHFVCNETEHERRMCSSQVDERTLRELYLLPFEFAVREGAVAAVMTSYNRLNGRYLADDERLLAGVLRGEWGFEGIVMTDWWALCCTVDAGAAGLDLEMPGPGRSFGPALAEAVRQGRAQEAWVEEKARRLLTFFDRFGALGDPPETAEAPADLPEDRALARRAAAEAIVLLRNEGGLLPLDPARVRRLALIGPGAEHLAIMGGGSARVTPHYTLDLAEALARRLGAGAEVALEAGVRLARSGEELARLESAGEGRRVASGLPGPGPGAGGSSGGCEKTLSAGISRAAELAASCDAAIVVVGTNDFWESEGYDRESMDLPCRQAELVEAVLDANPNALVALNTGSAVSMPFANRARALLQCWFGGQELANALADVIFGDAEPGGRLPFSIPERLEHTPAFGNFPAESSVVRYGEGQLVGYRWYDARALPVQFPFGHGLSYTDFQIGPARLSTHRLAAGGTVTVSVEVKNAGSRTGSEVVQVYIAPPAEANLLSGVPNGRLRPPKSLKGFAKVHLGAGESATVEVSLNSRSFAYYDVADTDWPAIVERLASPHADGSKAVHRQEAGWYLAGGTYEILVARSATDIVARLHLEVEGSERPLLPTEPVG
jgi:beta-glucosidase